MSEPISVGDLVVVVRWPCCGLRLGLIFKVEAIGEWKQFECRCGHKENVYERVAWDGVTNGIGAHLSRLKRIPPLSELDELETEKAKRDLEKLGWPV